MIWQKYHYNHYQLESRIEMNVLAKADELDHELFRLVLMMKLWILVTITVVDLLSVLLLNLMQQNQKKKKQKLVNENIFKFA